MPKLPVSLRALFHSAWNFVSLSIFFLFLQFPTDERLVKETEHGTLSYSQVPYYGRESKEVQVNSRELNIEGQSRDALLNYLVLNNTGESADAFLINAERYRFNLKYTSKYDSIFYQNFFNALQTEGLITLKDNIYD
ncbi:MAG: hypothetical protein ACJAXB_000293 [Candidatus Endobugula sp.]